MAYISSLLYLEVSVRVVNVGDFVECLKLS